MNARIQVLADHNLTTKQGVSGRIMKRLKKLSAKGASRQDVQESIASITYDLLHETMLKKKPHNDDVLLIPVLRAGLAMWGVANEFFSYPETSFLIGFKEKGTDHASVLWPKKNSTGTKNILILDPILATGDTLVRVCAELTDTSVKPHLISILSCYAAPQGVQKVLDKTRDTTIIVGCMAQDIDQNGYLIPPTHGDMGDKLFGVALQA